MPQHIGAQSVVAVIRLESQLMIRLDGVMPRILKLIGEQLIHEADSTALLELINQDARSVFGYSFECKLQLFSAVATFGAEDIAGKALRMDANQWCFLEIGLTHDESQNTIRLVLRLESE